MTLLLIDNYDSFTYNLRQLLLQNGVSRVDVVRNDGLEAGMAKQYSHIVISPGPGLPAQAGQLCDFIRVAAQGSNMLGICLGMQAIAEVFGGKLYQPGTILHGEEILVQPAQPVHHLYKGLELGFSAGLYHSWAVEPASLSGQLKVNATDGRGVVMGLHHTVLRVAGFQFHPESVMTPQGGRLIRNWLDNA